MAVTFRLAPHNILGRDVVEIHHDGEFIGQITSDDYSGVRIISKYKLEAKALGDKASISVSGSPANVIGVEITKMVGGRRTG